MEAPTNDPTFTLAPCDSIALIQSPNVSNIVEPTASPAASSIAGLEGPFVVDSPMISVVTPMVTLDTTRPSPSPTKLEREWLWISMNPGDTTISVASILTSASALASKPGGVIAVIWSFWIPTSPGNQAFPVPSTIRPPRITTSNASADSSGLDAASGLSPEQARNKKTDRNAAPVLHIMSLLVTRMARARQGTDPPNTYQVITQSISEQNVQTEHSQTRDL